MFLKHACYPVLVCSVLMSACNASFLSPSASNTYSTVPASQTLEGGIRVYLHPEGYTTFKQLFKETLHESLQTPFCIDAYTEENKQLCNNNSPPCSSGCAVNTQVSDISFSQSNTHNTLTVSTTVDFSVSGHALSRQWPSYDCSFNSASESVSLEYDISFNINAQTGKLIPYILQTRPINLDFPGLTGCSLVASDVKSSILQSIENKFGNTWTQHIFPASFQNAIESLPNTPLSLEFTYDWASWLIAGDIPKSALPVHTLLSAGGFARFHNGGFSYGVTTGFNAYTPSPHDCVSQMQPPDLSDFPWSLPTSTRNTPVLPVEPFVTPNNSDVSFQVSKTMLNLMGHHMVASGAFCLNAPAEHTKYLTIQNIARILGTNDTNPIHNPVYLYLQPQEGLVFEIPANNTYHDVTWKLHNAQLHASVVNGTSSIPLASFTADIDVDVDLNMSVDQQGKTHVSTTWVSKNVVVKNAVWYDTSYSGIPENSSAVLGSMFFHAFLNTLGHNAGSFLLPHFGNKDLRNANISSHTAPEDRFLVLSGSFSEEPSPIPEKTSPPAIEQIETTQKSLDAVASILSTGDFSDGPYAFVTFGLSDDSRPKEYAWRFAQGAWHPFSDDDLLRIQDPSLIWEGTHEIEIKQRIAQVPGSDSDPVSIRVQITHTNEEETSEPSSPNNDTNNVPPTSTDALSNNAESSTATAAQSPSSGGKKSSGCRSMDAWWVCIWVAMKLLQHRHKNAV